MIRRNQPCKDGDMALCQGHGLCRNPKADMTLGCSRRRKEAPVVGAQLPNEVGKVSSGQTQVPGGYGRESELHPKCSGKPLECFQRGWGKG